MAGNRSKQTKKPGVEVGDHVYFKLGDQHTHGKVVCHGEHGCHIDHEGGRSRVYWSDVLGHREHSAKSAKVVDKGADGFLMEDDHGRRRFIAGEAPEPEPERREDTADDHADLISTIHRNTPMTKSILKPESRLLFFKAVPIANRAGLTQKKITDKLGHQTTRWVRINPDQAANIQHGSRVKFKAGEHHGEGEVTAVGKHGVTAKDSTGREHQIHHHEITHHQQQAGGGEVQKPNYAPRMEGESDKAYAKRVVDKGDEVKHLPEEHDRYFHTEGSTHVPLENLHSTKSDEENQQGGDNGPKRMLAAYHGQLGKRAPITVMPHKDKAGHYEVVDGNGTLTSAKKLGWKGLPTKVVSRKEGETQKLEESNNEAVKAAGMHDFFTGPEYDNLPDKVSTKFKDWESLSEAGKAAQSEFENLMAKVGQEIGGESVNFSEHDYSKPGVIYGVGPMKTLESAKRKVDSKYGGDWSRLADLVRGSIGFDTVDQMKDGIEKLKAAGLKLATKPDNKFKNPTSAGYRDLNLNFIMPNGVAGELQLHLKPILAAKGNGHKDYEITRLLDAKAKNDPPLTEEEEKTLQEKLLAQRNLYGKAMQAALNSGGKAPEEMAKSNCPVVLLFRKVV